MVRVILNVTALAAFALPAVAQDCVEGMRPFEHAAGTTCIPEDPQRIVSTADSLITVPLLDLGAPIIATPLREMEDGTTYVRGATDIFGADVVAAADLAPIGLSNQLDLEAIVALGPDLIMAPEWQIESVEQYQAIAPTIVMPNNLPFLDYLALVADAAGVPGAYDDRLAEYEASVAEARERIGDPGAITVSRLDIDAEGLWFYPNWGALDQVIDDIGFARPEVQAEATENITGMSLENIAAFDGDVILTSYAPRFGQTIEDLTHGWMAAGGGLWQDLPGVQAGGHYWYERDIWNGQTFASLHAAIDGLTLLTAGRSFD